MKKTISIMTEEFELEILYSGYSLLILNYSRTYKNV